MELEAAALVGLRTAASMDFAAVFVTVAAVVFVVLSASEMEGTAKAAGAEWRAAGGLGVEDFFSHLVLAHAKVLLSLKKGRGCCR